MAGVLDTAKIAARLIITDMYSPSAETLAGNELRLSMERLQAAGCKQEMPIQGVSALQIPESLKEGALMFIAGSPANHDSSGKRASSDSRAGNVAFKEEVFYSLCWNTTAHQGVFMTYSAAACRILEYWVDRYDGRVLLVTPAHFALYRPRQGLADTLDDLTTDGKLETIVAAYVPSSWVPLLGWANGKLDMRKSISNILDCFPQGNVVTLAAYTGELELDLCGIDRNSPVADLGVSINCLGNVLWHCFRHMIMVAAHEMHVELPIMDLTVGIVLSLAGAAAPLFWGGIMLMLLVICLSCCNWDICFLISMFLLMFQTLFKNDEHSNLICLCLGSLNDWYLELAWIRRHRLTFRFDPAQGRWQSSR